MFHIFIFFLSFFLLRCLLSYRARSISHRAISRARAAHEERNVPRKIAHFSPRRFPSVSSLNTNTSAALLLFSQLSLLSYRNGAKANATTKTRPEKEFFLIIRVQELRYVKGEKKQKRIVSFHVQHRIGKERFGSVVVVAVGFYLFCHRTNDFARFCRWKFLQNKCEKSFQWISSSISCPSSNWKII